ncbi:MAG: DNA-protecting protein DprA [Deltaproteobacteria bacterium]|nr:DNA-protecting protein DprA [Deltaproteobacteria bacterium]
MRQQNLQDWLTLTFLPGLGSTLIRRLVERFGSSARVLTADAAQMGGVEGLGKKVIRLFGDRAVVDEARRRARRELQDLSRQQVSVVCLDEQSYPPLLRTIHDPPVLLYCRGSLECLQQPAVAIVGSRAATTYGRRISFELGRDLARRGICVVSGMAFGIDGEAHRGALAGGGPTVGVLGCGIDVVYPRQHARLFAAAAANGVLVSEYALGAGPEAFRFPARNRIISGLVQGVVVVEATRQSGSLITARLALEQDREVFAVPGRVDSLKSRGAHRLLQQGARLVGCADDILEELNLAASMHTIPGPEAGSSQPAGLSEVEQRLLSCLDVYPVNIDELVRLAECAPAEVHDLLLRLELKGLVRQLPGQQYERIQG